MKIVQMDGFEGRIGAGLWKMAKNIKAACFWLLLFVADKSFGRETGEKDEDWKEMKGGGMTGKGRKNENRDCIIFAYNV